MRITLKRGYTFLAGEGFWIDFGNGVVAALVLTWIRGGFYDMPWILIEFALVGFLISALVRWLVRPKTLGRIEVTLSQIPRASIVRLLLASALAVSLVFWSGPVIATWSYGGWLLAILLTIFSSLIICLLTARFPIAFGAISASCITVSIALERTRFELVRSRSHQDFWQQFLQSFQDRGFLIVWFIALGLSLIISIPIQIQRAKTESIKQ